MAGSDTSSLPGYIQATLEYIPVVAGAHMLQGVLVAAFAAGAAYLGTKLAMRQIAHGSFAYQDGIKTTTTSYWPEMEQGGDDQDGDITYFDQQITDISRIKLGDVFNPDRNRQGKAVLKVVKDARKMTSTDSPIVYSHLSDKMSGNMLEGVREAVCRLSRGYFSQVFNGEKDLLVKAPSDEYRPVEDIILPLYIVEPAASGKMAEKILYLRLSDGELPSLPSFEDVRFPDLQSQDFSTTYISDPEHIHADRYRLLERVLSDLQRAENAWMSQLGVTVPSGKFRHVETGEVIHAAQQQHADAIAPSLVS